MAVTKALVMRPVWVAIYVRYAPDRQPPCLCISKSGQPLKWACVAAAFRRLWREYVFMATPAAFRAMSSLSVNMGLVLVCPGS